MRQCNMTTYTDANFNCEIQFRNFTNYLPWMISPRFPKAGLGDHNFCRNPDSTAGGPWCYNSEGNSPRWENCGLPDCNSLNCELFNFFTFCHSYTQIRHFQISIEADICSNLHINRKPFSWEIYEGNTFAVEDGDAFKVSQSTTHHEGTANRAIDGDSNGDYSRK